MADRPLADVARILGPADEVLPFEGLPRGAIRPPDGRLGAEEARWHAFDLRIIFIGGKAGLITGRFPDRMEPSAALRALGLAILASQPPAADASEQVR